MRKQYECLGHYQKRVGNRLRKLRQRVNGLGGKAKAKDVLHTTADEKVIKTKQKAKGKLTDAAIDMFQKYFGIALRSDAKAVAEFRNNLLASFFHLASPEEYHYHTHCPAPSDSWCQFQRDRVNGTNLYKHGKGFDPNVINHAKLEYMKLTVESEVSPWSNTECQ